MPAEETEAFLRSRERERGVDRGDERERDPARAAGEEAPRGAAEHRPDAEREDDVGLAVDRARVSLERDRRERGHAEEPGDGAVPHLVRERGQEPSHEPDQRRDGEERRRERSDAEVDPGLLRIPHRLGRIRALDGRGLRDLGRPRDLDETRAAQDLAAHLADERFVRIRAAARAASLGDGLGHPAGIGRRPRSPTAPAALPCGSRGSRARASCRRGRRSSAA